jgi:hypothetical protein
MHEEVVLANQNEKSRHIGGKPDTRDEADNRKKQGADKSAPGQEKSATVKPKDGDVGDVDEDR